MKSGKIVRRWISLLLVGVMCCNMAFWMVGCAKTEYVTRSQYITMLAEIFGLDEYKSETAHFKDVKSNSEGFSAVQACGDWEILDTKEKKFKPKATATMDFALEAALKAAEVDAGEEGAVKYAEKEGFLSGHGYFDTKEKLTEGRAQEILEWAQQLYLRGEGREYVEKVVFTENIKDYLESEEPVSIVDENRYQVSAEIGKSLQAGDVVLLPATDGAEYGIPCKVEAIHENSDGTYTIDAVEPELEEIFEDVEIFTKAVPDMTKFVPAEGVEIVSYEAMSFAEGEDDIKFLGNAAGEGRMVQTDGGKGTSITLKVNLTKGNISLSPDLTQMLEKYNLPGEKLKLEVSDRDDDYYYWSGLKENSGEWFSKTKVLPNLNMFGRGKYANDKDIEAFRNGDISADQLKSRLDQTKTQQETEPSGTNKFKGGYEITGTIALKDVYVEPDIKLKKVVGIPTGIERAGVTLNCNAESNLKVSGEISDELTIGSVSIPVTAGFVVRLAVVLYGKVSGELGVKAVFNNHAKVTYENGGFKKTCEKSASLSGEASATADAGPKVTATISLCDLLDVIDAGISATARMKAGINGKYTTKYSMDEDFIKIERDTSYSYDVNVFIPIVTISVGGSDKTFASKLKIKGSWELVGEKTAPIKFTLLTSNGDVIIWQDVTMIRIKEEKKDDTTAEKPDKKTEILKGDFLQIDSSNLIMEKGDKGQINVTVIPDGYTKEELVWESIDPGIISVQGGAVKAMKNGSTVIVVKTPDGAYKCYCSVNVGDDYSVDFTPLDLSKLEKL